MHTCFGIIGTFKNCGLKYMRFYLLITSTFKLNYLSISVGVSFESNLKHSVFNFTCRKMSYILFKI